MSNIADVPFEQEMKYCGAEKRRSVLRGIYAFPDSPLLKESLRDIDKWFRDHGIDPETIQITDEDRKYVDRRKAEIGI